jgi:putative transposase
MSAHQAIYPIRTMARVLKVSASGYYAWRSRPVSARASADADLTRHIRTIHAGSHGTYGAPRVHAELKADSLSVGRKRIARLMRAAGIAGVSRRRSAPVTTRQARDHHPASDLVRRNFMAERPNALWVADITFLPTLAGFLYLAVVLDAWSRRIVGWAFSAWTIERIREDARKIGPATAALCEQILEARPHPEQGYRACLGIVRLAGSFGAARVEAAAERALEIGARTYGSVKSILDARLDRRPAPKRPAETAPILHPNIRGPRYYH